MQSSSVSPFCRDGVDNWSCKTCRAPVISSPPTNQHPQINTKKLKSQPI